MTRVIVVGNPKRQFTGPRRFIDPTSDVENDIGPQWATADSHYVQGARRKSRDALADPGMPRPDHPALARSLFETGQSHFRENLARGGIDIRHGAPRTSRAWLQN